MKNNLRNSCLLASILGIGLCHQASAVLVYNNSVNDLTIRFDPGVTEVGDEIILAGNQRNLVEFDFEYWGTSDGATPATFDGLVTARIRFYENIVGVGGVLSSGEWAPGGLADLPFYDTGAFAVGATPRSTLHFVAPEFTLGSGPGFTPLPGFIPLTMPLPDRFTWTVQFTTADPDDRVGVDLYSAPAAGQGQNFPDYWKRDLISGDWTLQHDPTGAIPFDFAARINAVPETTGIGICIMSFLGLLGFSRLTRRTQ